MILSSRCRAELSVTAYFNYFTLQLLRFAENPTISAENEIPVNIVGPRSLQLSGENFTLD